MFSQSFIVLVAVIARQASCTYHSPTLPVPVVIFPAIYSTGGEAVMRNPMLFAYQ